MPTHTFSVEVDGQIVQQSAAFTVTPPPSALPLMGMATVYADWDARVAETGPVNMRRLYVGSTWNHSSLMARINATHALGVVPYASMKNGGTVASWSQMVAGQWDAQIDALATAIAAGPAPVRLAYHHEPRPATLAELAVWGRAHTRFNLRAKAIAGSKVIVGPCDNGHPWSDQAWAHLTDAELAGIYTDAFVASCDAAGADFYDGETNTNPGEPAWPKARGFWRYWRNTRGFTGRLDAGEWNFVEPADVALMWEQLLAGGFYGACVFNSPENNRADLPTGKGLGTPPSWLVVPGTPRMAALRTVLDQAGIPGR